MRHSDTDTATRDTPLRIGVELWKPKSAMKTGSSSLNPMVNSNKDPNIKDFRESILPEVKAYDHPRILLNFAYTRRMGSSGLSVLMQAYTITKNKQGRIGVIHIGRHINNLLVLTRLASLFERFDNEVDAIAQLSGRSFTR